MLVIGFVHAGIYQTYIWNKLILLLCIDGNHKVKSFYSRLHNSFLLTKLTMLTDRYYNPGTYCNQLTTEEMRSDLDLRSDLKLGYTSCAYPDQLFVTRSVKNRV